MDSADNGSKKVDGSERITPTSQNVLTTNESLETILYSISLCTSSSTISAPQNVLSFSDLVVTVTDNSLFKRIGIKKTTDPTYVLHKMKGEFSSGKMCALMGSSGSGKTTLMNALSHNTQLNMKVYGNVLFNGTKVNMRQISGYVQQIDLFFPRFTVREHLKFYLKLYSRTKRSKEQKRALIKNLIQIFSLERCFNNTIGDGFKIKGISGGEKKRLSIATELLKTPKIIFADEPTSGLDSYMAETVVSSMKVLCLQGTMVICTIHQPSSKIFERFDEVCLLSRGHLIACTSIPNLMDIFKNAGYACPSMYNPADHFIHTTALIPGKEEEYMAVLQNLLSSSEKFQKQSTLILTERESNVSNIPGKLNRIKPGSQIGVQLRELIVRDFRTTKREPLVLYATLAQNAFMGLLAGSLFYNQKFSLTSLRNLFGVLFFMTTVPTFQNIFAVINLFPLELNIFNRENGNKLYGATPYFASKLITELPLAILTCIIFLTISYFMIGLRTTAEAYFYMLLVHFLITECAISFGYLVSTICGDVELSSVVVSPFTILLLLFGGFVIKLDDIPVYYKWISYLSWFRYSYELFATFQFKDNKINCDDIAIYLCTKQKTIMGKFALEQYGLKEDRYLMNILCLVGLIVIYRSMAYIALLIRARGNR